MMSKLNFSGMRLSNEPFRYDEMELRNKEYEFKWETAMELWERKYNKKDYEADHYKNPCKDLREYGKIHF